MLGEAGDQQPRSLSVSYLKPILNQNQGEDAIELLNQHREQQQKVYGASCNVEAQVNTLPGEKSMSLPEFIATLCE